MKNLKKVLALVLAMSTVFGLSVSAGAAATDFNDYGEIENKEAVEVMNALNVIGGNDKGDFNPDGYLTRAEMCKMVSYVMNGGKAPVLSTSATPSYSDIKGHWGEAYIEYATSMGIVGGVGGGKFNPDGTLTGTQAAKMMLTAMGYNAEVFGFGGTGWDVNVNRYANEAGLYDELGSMQPNLPISRDDAAQLMYNAMQATMIERGWTLNPATGEKTETYTPWLDESYVDGVLQTTPHTLLGEKYNGAIAVGYMSDFTYDSVKDEWTYTFTNGAGFGGNAITQNKIVDGKTQKSTTDYTEFFGQQVKVIYNTKDQKITYGVYANDSSVVATGATGNVEDYNDTADTVTVSGKDYKLKDEASAISVYNNGSDTAVLTLDALKTDKSAYDFKLVDNTGDGKVDAAVRTPVTVTKINYVGKDSVQFSNGIGSKKIDDLTTYDGYAAGDWVYFIDKAHSTTEQDTIVKAELKTGTIDGVRGGGTANVYTEYQIDGNWLAASNNSTYTAGIVKAEVGDTVEYVSLGSTIFYSKITDLAATSKNIAMVVTAGVERGNNSSNLSGDTLKAKLLLADGSTTTAKITKVNGVAVSANVTDQTTLNGLIGTLVTYRVDGSDYELMAVRNDNTATTDVDESNLAGYKYFYNTNAGYSNGKVEGFELADDAVIYFIGNTTGGSAADGNDVTNDGSFRPNATRKADVYTGKEIKNTWGTQTVGLHVSAVLTQEINGFTYAKVVLMGDENGLPKITAGSNYGYLSAPTSRSTEGNKTYLNFTIHTANGELKAKAESTDAPWDYPQGAIITYDVVSDGVIKNVNIPAVTTGMVTGWDGDSKIALDNTSSEVDAKDTTVLYVDSDKKVGVEGGSIQKAADMDGNGIVDRDNVRYILAANHVVLLVVDVNNDMKANPAKVSSSVDNAADLKEALKYDNMTVTLSDSDTFTGDLKLNGNTLSVASGEVLTVTGDLYMQGGTITGAGKVVVNGKTYMGSTLSIAEFETNQAEIVNGATMVISGGKVTIKSGLAGNGKLLVEGTTIVNVEGKLAVNATVNGSATLAYDSIDSSVKVDGNSGNVYQYNFNKDTTVRAFNVVK